MQSSFPKTSGAGFLFSILLGLGFWSFLTFPALAHKVSSASLILYLDTEEERSYRISIAMEVESSGDAALDDEISPEDAARSFAENYLSVLIDEKEQSKKITTELVNTSDSDTPQELQRLSVLVEWKATLPPDGKEIALFLKETSEMSIVMATVKNGITGRRLQVIFAGEYSKTENIEPLVKGNPFEQAAEAETIEKEKGKTDPESVEKSTSPEAPVKKSSLFVERGKLGATAIFHSFALPLCLLLSFLLLAHSSQIAARAFFVFLVAFGVGISLAAFGLMPPFAKAGIVAAVTVLILSIDNLFSSEFLGWRYLPGAVGSFFLGNDIVQGSNFLRLGSPPISPLAFLPYAGGFVLVALVIAMILGVILLPFGQFKWFHKLIVIPGALVIAGVAVYLLVGAFFVK